MASTRIIESGKYKGKTLAECPREYIVWASKHEKNFAESNQWVSRDARFLLEREVAVVVKPRWNDWAARWDDPTTGKPVAMLGGVPYWNEEQGFIEHPEGKLWNEWMEEWVEPVPVKPLDVGMRGNLNGSRAFSLMR